MTRRGFGVTLAAGLAIGASLMLAAGCTSLDKDEMQARLLALPGNAVLEGQVRRAELSDGTEATWVRFERPGAPRLLLVHGTPGTLFNWTPVLFGEGDRPGLVDDFDVLAVELAGHGISRDGLEPTTFQQCADHLGAVAARFGPEPFVVVANSYGGEVAWRMALDRPELVSTLVLMSSSGYPREDDEWLPEEVAMREWPGAGFGWLLNSRDRIGVALEPHFREGPPADFAEETFLVCDNASNWRTMVGLARDEDGTRSDELPGLVMPVLLLWGVDDVAYPPERFARLFERDIPDAELVLLEDTGHYPPLEDPAAFVDLMRQRFLKR